MGFQPPPADGGIDGNQWDVYIENIDPYGYTTYSKDPNNPGAYISYMTMDNNYDHTDTPGLDGARVTAAHEFFHMVQFGYNFRNADIFMMEAASTWMEDVVYDYVNDYYFYLDGFFNGSNYSFNYTNGWREYGLCTWFHFLEKRLNTRDFAKTLWEAIPAEPAMNAMATTLLQYGTTFEDELHIFYGWNYMTGYRADTDRFYPEGDAYPVIRLSGDFSLGQDTTLIVNVTPTAAKYYRFTAGDGSTFTLIPSNLNMANAASSNECTLILSPGFSHPFFTDIGGDHQANISADDYSIWKCVAVTEIPGQPAIFTPFDGSIINLNEDELPASFPSPFNPGENDWTSIPFVLDEPSDVRILIAQASGHVVLDTEQSFLDGIQFFIWDGNDNNGNPAPSGIYVYLISRGGDLLRREKLALVR